METLLKFSKTTTESSLKNTIDELHQEAILWSSQLKFALFELNFSKNLIDSYAFEPKTANSFLLLQEFKSQNEKLLQENPILEDEVKKHENSLGSTFEYLDTTTDSSHYKNHQYLKARIEKHVLGFETLKAEIFDYCEHVLRYNKRP